MGIKSLLKKVSGIILVPTMAFGVMGCVGKNNEDAIKTAQEKLADITSMSYDMTMNMEMSAEGQSMKMSTTATVDQIVDPLQMKMDMIMDMGELGATQALAYIVSENDQYVEYIGMDFGDGNMEWQKMELGNLEDQIAQYDGKASSDLYLSSAENFKEKGKETINGSEATRYDGVIPEGDINKVMEASGALSQFSALGINEEDLEAMVKDLGKMAISIWIDNESSYPVKYEIDMTDIMQSLMSNMMKTMGGEEMELTIDKMFLSMTLSNFNGVEKIEIPEEAKGL